MSYRDPDRDREYERRKWIAARRQAWLLANGPCRKCGSLEQLEVDHVVPSTKVSHRIWSYSAARREAEPARCQALCRSCHREKSAWEVRRRERHGSYGILDGRDGSEVQLLRAAGG